MKKEPSTSLVNKHSELKHPNKMEKELITFLKTEMYNLLAKTFIKIEEEATDRRYQDV